MKLAKFKISRGGQFNNSGNVTFDDFYASNEEAFKYSLDKMFMNWSALVPVSDDYDEELAAKWADVPFDSIVPEFEGELGEVTYFQDFESNSHTFVTRGAIEAKEGTSINWDNDYNTEYTVLLSAIGYEDKEFPLVLGNLDHEMLSEILGISVSKEDFEKATENNMLKEFAEELYYYGEVRDEDILK